jgi:hypothetical protein
VAAKFVDFTTCLSMTSSTLIKPVHTKRQIRSFDWISSGKKWLTAEQISALGMGAFANSDQPASTWTANGKLFWIEHDGPAVPGPMSRSWKFRAEVDSFTKRKLPTDRLQGLAVRGAGRTEKDK